MPVTRGAMHTRRSMQAAANDFGNLAAPDGLAGARPTLFPILGLGELVERILSACGPAGGL